MKAKNAIILKNSKALRDYQVLSKYEAGIALKGTEVKSLREGKGQISEAYAKIENGELFLLNARIDEYSNSLYFNHDPKAPRKLLLKKNEIRKIEADTEGSGISLIPLSLYWKEQRVKVELAVCRGKVEIDKRRTIQDREAERGLKRVMMSRMKGK